MIPLKEQYYNSDFYLGLARNLNKVHPKVNVISFHQDAVKELPRLELKQRISLASELCRKYLPDNYKKSLKLLYSITDGMQENFSNIFLSDFVAQYGTGHFDLSMQALKDFTSYSSSEMAIRTYLQKDFPRTMRYVYQWADDDNFHVRRLASEGTRPRLPWAMRISELLENPSHAFPILESLKSDPEKYVHKSVANHLNDISKDHPEFMLQKVASWDLEDKTTHWVVKHASRSLIKKGHPEALAMFGAEQKPEVKLRKFSLGKKQLHLGETLPFTLSLVSDKSQTQRLVVDYKVHFVKHSGERKPKVFKIRELELEPGEVWDVTKKHLFKDFTTRKHYAGEHAIEIVVNGKSLALKKFKLDI